MASQPVRKVLNRGSRNSFQFPRKMFNDMRNNPSMTISPQKGQSLRTAAALWLSRRNETISQLTGCTVTNLSFVLSQAAGVLAAVAVVLCTDGVAEYGWAALCAAQAVRLARPMVKELKGQEGGAL